MSERVSELVRRYRWYSSWEADLQRKWEKLNADVANLSPDDLRKYMEQTTTTTDVQEKMPI